MENNSMIVRTNSGKVILYDITILLARTVAKRMEWGLTKKRKGTANPVRGRGGS
jgi:hypothetical protein